MRTENWWVRVKIEQSGMDYSGGIKKKEPANYEKIVSQYPLVFFIFLIDEGHV